MIFLRQNPRNIRKKAFDRVAKIGRRELAHPAREDGRGRGERKRGCEALSAASEAVSIVPRLLIHRVAY